MIYVTSTGNGRLSAPGGMPLSLTLPDEPAAEGAIPPEARSVTITAKMLPGTTGTGTGGITTNTARGGTLYAALYSYRTIGGTAAWYEVTATRTSTDLVSVSERTISVSVPANSTDAPAVYLVRLWATDVTGTDIVSITSMAVS